MKKENIKVEGRRGTWYVIDESVPLEIRIKKLSTRVCGLKKEIINSEIKAIYNDFIKHESDIKNEEEFERFDQFKEELYCSMNNYTFISVDYLEFLNNRLISFYSRIKYIDLYYRTVKLIEYMKEGAI